MGSTTEAPDSTVPTQVASQVSASLPQVTHDAPAAVLLVDLDARSVVYVNSVAEQMAPGVGLPAPLEAWSDAAALRDLDGEPLSETHHPLSLVARSQPVAGQAVSAARATELGRQREPLWAVALPMHDAPRLEGHALVVFLPLRDRESAEAAATAAQAAAELRDRAVLATGMAFTVADARAEDLPLVWVNPAFTATTGYSFEEAVGRNCRFLQGPGTDPGAPAAMREALAAGQDVTVTLLNHRRDGTAFWNQVSVSPVHGPDGAVTHFVAIQTDVTSRVDADAERDRALEAERAARAEAEQAHARLALLAEATSRLAASLDVAECCQRLVDLAVPELADWALVATTDGQGHVVDVVACHRDPQRSEDVERYAGMLRDAALPGPIRESLRRSPEAQRYSDCASPERRRERETWVEDPALLDLSDRLGAGSVLLVPLPGRSRVVDLMMLVRGPDSPPHTEEDLGIATDLGRRAGLILDNARLYQEEHRIAEALQRSLLPDLPSVPGVRAAARYRASASGAAVGGDFYELIDLPGGAVGMAVGDVMGHDVMAAAAMGHLRGLLRACAFDTDRQPAPGDRRRRPEQEPGDVLDRVDQLVQGLGIATLATVAYARLARTEDGAWLARYATAGHPPLLVRGPDGRVDVLDDAAGLLLGVQASTRPTTSRVLAPGSTLLAYTDGLVERRGEDADLGVARLVAALASGPADVEALVDHLLAELGGGDDDVALLAVQLDGREDA